MDLWSNTINDECRSLSWWWMSSRVMMNVLTRDDECPRVMMNVLTRDDECRSHAWWWMSISCLLENVEHSAEKGKECDDLSVISYISSSLLLVWWMGVDYELFCATLSTRSDLLVIYTLRDISGKFQLGNQFISLIYIIRHTNSWVSAGVYTVARKKKLY